MAREIAQCEVDGVGCCCKRLQTFLFKLQIFFQTKQFKISTQNTTLHHNAVKRFAFQMLNQHILG